MASIGHLAVGLLAGRLHGGADDLAEPQQGPRETRPRLGPLLSFAALSALPDFDVFLVALGVPDAGAGGHRGASHSFFLAVIIGLLTASYARRFGWPVVRTAIAATLAVASHGILDAIGEGGRGIPLFWPLSDARYLSPWRLLPDAPRGLQMLSRHGLLDVCVELLVFFPMAAYALWPSPAFLRKPRGAFFGSNAAPALVAKRVPSVVTEPVRR